MTINEARKLKPGERVRWVPLSAAVFHDGDPPSAGTVLGHTLFKRSLIVRWDDGWVNRYQLWGRFHRVFIDPLRKLSPQEAT